MNAIFILDNFLQFF